MSVALTSKAEPLAPMSFNPATGHPRYTRGHVRFLQENGLLPECGYELIDGEIVFKMKNPPHIYALKLLVRWLNGVFGEDYVYAQEPVEIASSDSSANFPEPDVTVVNRPFTEFLVRHVSPTDISLLVEVTDTTRSQDFQAKVALYAGADIPEYWILDILRRRIRVHRNPRNGIYADIQEHTEEEQAAPFAAPDSFVRVGDLLPPTDAPMA